jgi:hypothetical protein
MLAADKNWENVLLIICIRLQKQTNSSKEICEKTAWKIFILVILEVLEPTNSVSDEDLRAAEDFYLD